MATRDEVAREIGRLTATALTQEGRIALITDYVMRLLAAEAAALVCYGLRKTKPAHPKGGDTP